MGAKKLTAKELKKFGFIPSKGKGTNIYYKDDYGLKYEFNNWLIIANHAGIELTGLTVIETIDELKLHYKESTGKDLTAL